MARTAYLDTALWYDLAQERIVAPEFEAAVRNGAIKPILSFIHLMEFAQSDLDSRNRTTHYIDTLTEGGRVVWIKTLPVVAEAELRQAFLKFQRVDPGPLNVFADAFVDTLRTSIPGLDREEARTYKVTKLVSILNGLRRFRHHQLFRRTAALRDIVRLQLLRAREGRAVDPFHSQYIKNIWADMPRGLQTPGGVLIDLTSPIRDGF